MLRGNHDQRLAERRRARKGPKEDKGPPKWQQFLSRGSARTTFAVGAVLTLPGASYLAGLDEIGKHDYSDTKIVVLVVAFNLVMLLLLELPLAGYVLAPEWTPGAVDRAKAWAARRGRAVATYATFAVGAALVLKGIIGLLS